MEQILELDREWLLYFNNLNHPVLDPVMFLLTKTVVWIPLFLLLAYFIIKDYGKASWIFFLGIALTITLADQVTSGFMKPYFSRLRPSHDPELQHLMYLVNQYKGGKYGFASSHAANTFGVAMFFWLLFASRRRWMVLLFAWALFVSYTRIYLGVHFPSDILVGGVVGILSATLGYAGSVLFYNRQKSSKHAEQDN